MREKHYGYFPGNGKPEHTILQRFLPLIPKNMVRGWLDENVAKGNWIIDPFGASPNSAIEAASAGYKILVICNNPILQFLIQLIASAPSQKEIISALSDFAKEKRDTERLETYLQSLYQTECPNCAFTIPVQFFIWRKNESTPKSKFIDCAKCSCEGEYPVSNNDLLRLESLGNDALQRARALQPVSLTPESNIGAREAIETYPARSLYFLFSMLNRIERMQSSPRSKQLLIALFLNALDEGNTLWTWPSSRNRPKQISTPPQFRENNLWFSIENAIPMWTKATSHIEFTIWPELPESPSGICLFKGRINNFIESNNKVPLEFSAAVSIFPRPNQAFWTYSALWSGWIWGRDAVVPIKSSLERRRYDWFWYCGAIHKTLSKLRKFIPSNCLFWGIIPELEVGFLTSTIVAAEGAGFNIQACAIRKDDEIAQCSWKVGENFQNHPPGNITNSSLEAIKEFLIEKNEPASKLELITASLIKIANKREIPYVSGTMPYFSLKEYQQKIPALLSDKNIFNAYESLQGSVEKQSWWLRNFNSPSSTTLADRIENQIIEILSKQHSVSKYELDKILCKIFIGLLTPKKELIEFCLESYAQPEPNEPILWKLKTNESTENRNKDIQQIKNNLIEIGSRLEYSVNQGVIIDWRSRDTGETLHRFYITNTASFSNFIYSTNEISPYKQYIVFPGSRSKLLAYKMDSDPRLSSRMKNWIILKYRLINDIQQSGKLDHSGWEEMIQLDPPQREEPSQFSIFN